MATSSAMATVSGVKSHRGRPPLSDEQRIRITVSKGLRAEAIWEELKGVHLRQAGARGGDSIRYGKNLGMCI